MWNSSSNSIRAGLKLKKYCLRCTVKTRWSLQWFFYKWVKRFQEWCEDIVDGTWTWSSCSFSLCTEENVDRLHALVLTNWRIMQTYHIQQVQPILWKNKSWIWHHVNTPAHSSMLVCEFVSLQHHSAWPPLPPPISYSVWHQVTPPTLRIKKFMCGTH